MKIGIFYLLCGGGHLAAAKAVRAQCQKTYPETEVEILEAKSSSRLVSWLIGGGYALAINRAPSIWKFLFWFYTLRPMVRATAFIFGHFFLADIRAAATAQKFDRLVSTHFFLTPVLAEAARQLKLTARVFCLVTDPFTVPTYWFLDREVDYLVFSEVARQIGLRCGISAERIKIFNPLINPEFESGVVSVEDSRAKLGLSPADKVILVVGGGDGLPRGAKIVRSLCEEFFNCYSPVKGNPVAKSLRLDSRPRGNDTKMIFNDSAKMSLKILVVCGRDQNFYNQSKKLQKEFPQIAQVFGFIKLAEIMPAADIVVGKAGPGVVFESLLLQKPIILSSYVSGQERGNMEYVVQNEAGYFEPKQNLLAKRVQEILIDKIEYARLMENIKKLNLKNGAAEVARDIVEG